MTPRPTARTWTRWAHRDGEQLTWVDAWDNCKVDVAEKMLLDGETLIRVTITESRRRGKGKGKKR